MICNNLQLFIHSFIHSGYFYSRLFTTSTPQSSSRHSMDTVPEFHAKAPQATVSEGLAQGPYVAARVGVEPMTLWTKGVDGLGGPRTETKFTKWSVSLKRLRTAVIITYLGTRGVIMVHTYLDTLIHGMYSIRKRAYLSKYLIFLLHYLQFKMLAQGAQPKTALIT